MSCHVITEAQTCESWRVWQEEFSNPLNRFPWPSHLVALKYSQLSCSASPSPKYPMTWRWLRAPEWRKSSESQSLPPSHPPAPLTKQKGSGWMRNVEAEPSKLLSGCEWTVTTFFPIWVKGVHFFCLLPAGLRWHLAGGQPAASCRLADCLHPQTKHTKWKTVNSKSEEHVEQPSNTADKNVKLVQPLWKPTRQ